MYYLTLDGKLQVAPLEEEKIHRVLDLGTGTGIWAMDFGTPPESSSNKQMTDSMKRMSIHKQRYTTHIDVNQTELTPFRF
jgi:ubiquinone/menaquinone biosynthesis C-methylase UbiE